MSSIGGTAFPYCLWIKKLSLGDLEQVLQSLASDKLLRPVFFEGPMAEFEITSGQIKTRRKKSSYVVLEWQQIIEMVGDKITTYAKDSADEEDKAIQLTSLEGHNLPTPLLALWVSRLSTLTTLTIRDGSVLTEEVGVSLRENCPSFKDLTCYNIRGPTVDENMAAFFRALKENSLEQFTVLGSNDIGRETLVGLMQHSLSLRSLNLSTLHHTSLPFIHVLSACTYLESLQIESLTPVPPSSWALAADGVDPLIEVAAWLNGSKHLRKLSISKLGGAAKLLAEALKSSDLRLRDLDVKLIDDDEAFYTALESQADLESLSLKSTNEITDLMGVRHDNFLVSICACKKLKELNVMQAEHLQLTTIDLTLIQESLHRLQTIEFDGELLDDSIWRPLSGMPALSSISINGSSVFTYEGIKSFMDAVRATGPRPGFRLDVMNQAGEARITPAQETKLANLAIRHFGGSFEFQYWRNPSEDEMSELSD